MFKVTNNQTIKKLASEGYIFLVNHSGGKDSQATYLAVRDLVPADQIIVVHASLGNIEWNGENGIKGAVEHIEETITHPLHVVKGVDKTGQEIDPLKRMRRQSVNRKTGKLNKARLPGIGICYLRSELKHGPIQKMINNLEHAQYQGKIVNVLGIRGHESTNRESGISSHTKSGKQIHEALGTVEFKGKEVITLSRDLRYTTRKRDQLQWYPIFDWTENQVKCFVHSKGQELHPVYALGMRRFSCCFCVYSTPGDVALAGELNPTLLAEYAKLEAEIGHTMYMVKGKPVSITEYAALAKGER